MAKFLLILMTLILFPALTWAQGNEPVTWHIHKSAELLDARDVNGALEYAEKAVEIDPGYSKAWLQHGRVLMLRGEYEKAIDSFRKTLTIAPGDEKAEGWLLTSLIIINKFDDVVTRFREIKNPATEIKADQVYLIYKNLYDNNDDGDAKGLSAALASLLPAESPIRQVAESINMALSGQYKDAQKRLSSMKPENGIKVLAAVGWLYAGLNASRAEDYAFAIKAHSESLKLHPLWSAPRRELGWAYRADNNPAKAAETWKAGVDATPELSSWLIWIAEALLEADLYDDAERYVDTMIEKEVNKEKALVLKEMLLLHKNNAGETAKFEASITSTAGTASTTGGEYVIAMGHALYNINVQDYEKAIVYLEKLEKTNPDDEEVKRTITRVYSDWSAALRKEQYDDIDSQKAASAKVLTLLKKRHAMEPQNGGVLRDLGWALWSSGDRDGAIKAWEKAIDSGNIDRDTIIPQIISAMAETGQTNEALSLYRKWTDNARVLALAVKLIDSHRLIAADKLLEATFEHGDEDQTETGLYLAKAKALKNVCSVIPKYMKPFFNKKPQDIKDDEAHILLEIVEQCYDDMAVYPVIKDVERMLAGKPAFYNEVTRLMEETALNALNEDKKAAAHELYTRVLQRGPTSPEVWISAVNAADWAVGRDAANAVINRALTLKLPESIANRLKGRKALMEGDTETVVKYFKESLKSNPAQSDMHYDLFQIYIDDRLYQEAFKELKWMEEKYERGDLSLKATLARMYSQMWEHKKALDLWEELQLSYPSSASYSVEAARAKFRVCQVDDALSILEPLADMKPNLNVYMLLGEVYAFTARHQMAVSIADKGLAQYPDNLALARIKAEGLDAMFKAEEAAVIARELYEKDSGSSNYTRLLGRSLTDSKKEDEAKALYENTLKRNPLFVPSQTYLRNVHAWSDDMSKAFEYAQTTKQQREWDVSARLNYAISAAEDQRFATSLKTLRPLAYDKISHAIPVLVYNDVTMCNTYEGRNTLSQVKAHIKRLIAEGIALVPIDKVNFESDKPQAVIVFNGGEPEALAQINKLIMDVNGYAHYADTVGQAYASIPGTSYYKDYEALKSSGRWTFASNGPMNFYSMVIDEKGTKGNPLVNKLFRDGKPESGDEMKSRINKSIVESAAYLDKSRPFIMLYPRGDYGHMSVDTVSEAVEALHDSVSEHYNYAIATDESGFMMKDHDPYRVPAKFVPSSWNVGNLMNHVFEKNPVTLAKLEYAKVLSWQRQFEKANTWFKEAERYGANPHDVNYHWSTNAYYEEDVEFSNRLLNIAESYEPESERVSKALKRNESRESSTLDFRLRGSEDKDNRTYFNYGPTFSTYLRSDLTLSAYVMTERFARETVGKEQGYRPGASARWWYKDEQWIEGNLWYLDMKDPADLLGGDIKIHIPQPELSGYFEGGLTREEVNTVEAVRKGINQNTLNLSAYIRLLDFWDISANPYATTYSDNNNTVGMSGRLIWRAHEWPFLGLGYLFNVADSKEYPADYWAPVELQQHQAYANVRGEKYGLHYSVSGRAGYSADYKTDWRWVWGARAQLDYDLIQKLKAYVEADHFETSTYFLNRYTAGMKYTF